MSWRLPALLGAALLSMGAISQVITGGSSGGNGATASDPDLTVTQNPPAFSSALSVQFNPTGGSGQRIEGPTDTALFTSAPIGSFSTCFWYKLDASLAQFNGPVGSSPSFALSSGWGVYRDTSDDTVRLYVGSFSGSQYTETITGIWDVDSVWHHLCAVFDGPNRQGTFYWDNAKSQSGINQLSATRPLGVEVQYGTLEKSVATDFNGKLDEVALWAGVVLTDANVTCIYNSGVPTDPTDCVLGASFFLRMGDDAADDITVTSGQITDQTANGNDFTPLAVDNVPPVNFNVDVP